VLETGAVFGDYVVEGPLGEGGMCVVLRARQRSLDRSVALKLLRPDVAELPDERRRFLREARTCAALRHPPTVAVYEADERDGQPFIAMELVDGTTLRARMRSAPSSALLELCAAIARALAHAHGVGVVHRDLKPDNVLVTCDGRPKVVDWGLARAIQDESGLTKTGVLVGTPAYMAPEQILGQQPTPAVDLYALGVILFELASGGRRPFETGDVRSLLTSRLSTEAPGLRTVAHRAPLALSTLVRDLLQRNPAGRPSSAEVVAARLDDIVADLRSRQSSDDVADSGQATSAAVRAVKPTKLAESPRAAAARGAPPTGNAVEPRSFRLLPVAVLATVLLAGGIWHLAGRFAPTPPQLDGVRLPRADVLQLSFIGEPACTADVVLDAVTPGGLVPAVVSFHEVALTTGTRLPGGTFRLDLPLPWVPSCPTTVHVDVAGERRSLVLDPRPTLVGELRAVTDLVGEDFERTLREVNRLRNTLALARSNRSSYPRQFAEADVQMRRHLNDVGLTTDVVERLRTVLAGLLVPPSGRRVLFDGDDVARWLTPLRYLETALSEIEGLEPPWGCTSALLGYGSERVGTTEPDAGWTAVADRDTTLPRGERFCLQWFGPDDKIKKYAELTDIDTHTHLHQMALQAMLSEWPRDDGHREVLPGLRDLAASKTYEVVVGKPAGLEWPPGEALLELTTRFMSHDFAVLLSVNGGGDMLFVDTSQLEHRDRPEFTRVLSDMRTVVPIDPRRLKVGKNTVRLTLTVCPVVASTSHPLGLRRIRLLVR